MKYEDLNEEKKKKFLYKQYVTNKKSFGDIANEVGTYANKIRRDAIKLKIPIRDKSEAQKNALKTGKTTHPTEGKKRPENIKQRIGMSVLESWQNLDDQTLKDRKNKAKINWDNKSDDEKIQILKKANDAVRQTSKTGSKLEKFLFKNLLADGYNVDFHKEHSILNTKLQIDLFLPKHNIAIEVDGPSHFEPVWGDEALSRNKKYDNKKTGLILGKGLYLIRIKQKHDFSKSRGLLILEELKNAIKDIINNLVAADKVIKIGE